MAGEMAHDTDSLRYRASRKRRNAQSDPIHTALDRLQTEMEDLFQQLRQLDNKFGFFINFLLEVKKI